MNRRQLLQSAAVGLAGTASTVSASTSQASDTTAALSMTADWDKVFPKSAKVNHRKAVFCNRFGIELVCDVYEPKDGKEPLAAVAVTGPFGAVKEQSSGLYAQTLAEAGFFTIAFDPSFTGESGGFPRHIASPDLCTEDFSAAVDFLSNEQKVDAERIGILGVCGWGGFALNAASGDSRIKATVASTMYDMSRVNTYGYNDAMTDADRWATKTALAKQRTEDFKTGVYARMGGLPEKLTGREPQFVQDYWSYYKTPRGFQPRSINSNGAWNLTSALSFMNAPLHTFAGDIQTPVLVIHGEKAHSRYFGEDAFKKLKGDNKRLMIIPGANHVDLYDNFDKIPFAEIVAFYQKSLV